MSAEKGDSEAEKSKCNVNGVFDGADKGSVDSALDPKTRVFDTKKRLKGKSRPEYRRVRKNFKSSERYWLERNRRKQVTELLDQHLTCKKIAAKLGVSDRTVKRDIAKIRPYYERRVRHVLNGVDEEQRVQLASELEGLSSKARLKLLKSRQKVNEYMLFNLLKQRNYLRHQLAITIDLDKVSEGFPKIEYKPQPPFSVKFPFKIILEFNKNGVTTQVLGIVVGGQG